MTTINISDKKLALIIVSSISIALIAFVLGFIFSKHQSAQSTLFSQAPISSPEPNIEIIHDHDAMPLTPAENTELEKPSEVLALATLDSEPENDIMTTSSTAYLGNYLDALVKSEDFAFEALKTEAVSMDADIQQQIDEPLTIEKISMSSDSRSMEAPVRPEYALQIGVFSKKQGAIEWANTVEGKAPNVQVFTNNKSDGRVLYSVISGLFSSKDAAKKAGEQLSKNYRMTYYVTSSESFGHEIFIVNNDYVVAKAF